MIESCRGLQYGGATGEAPVTAIPHWGKQYVFAKNVLSTKLQGGEKMVTFPEGIVSWCQDSITLMILR